MKSDLSRLGHELPLMLNPHQVAEYLQVPVEDVYTALEQGRLPGIEAKGRWRIPRDHLLEWLREQIAPALAPGEKKESLTTDMPGTETQQTPVGGAIGDEAVQGTVQRFNPERGWGFITLVDGRNVFFHQNVVQEALEIGTGDIVSVEVGPPAVEKDRYPSATTVRVLKSSQQGQGDKAKTLYLTALDAREQGKFQEARKHFEEAIADGAFLLIYQTYATMEENQGHLEEANQVLRRGLKVFPLVGALYEQLGEVLYKQGRLSEALEACRHGVRAIPYYLPLRRQLISLLLRTGPSNNIQEVVEQIQQAESLGLPVYDDPEIGSLLRFFRDSDLGRQAFPFFEAAKFAVQVLRVTPLYASFTVKATTHEYIDAFDLRGQILVRAFDKEVNWQNLQSYLDDIQVNTEAVQRLNLDVAFVVMKDDSPCRHALMRANNENRTALVPIALDTIQRAIDGDAMDEMLRVLDEWLSRRDLYATGFPVSGNLFFGRESELAEINQTIRLGQHIGIFGLRRVGKTSLLYQLREKRTQDLVAYVDLHNVPADNQSGNYLYWAIARELKLRLQTVYPDIAATLKLALGDSTTYQSVHIKRKTPSRFDHDLRLILDRLSKLDHEVQIIIALDEIEMMLPVSSHPGFEGYVDFFAHLRGISQTTPGKLITVVTAANPALSEQPVWAGRDNPVFGFYKEIFLPPLKRDECDMMVTELGRRMGISYTPEALIKLYDETGGHPSMVRRLCSYVQRREPWQGRSLLITEEVASNHIEDFLRDEPMFEEILNRLERHFPLERDLLLFIADGIGSENELIGMINMPISTAIRHLVGYQLVVREGDAYKVKFNLLTRWLKRYQLGRV